MNSVFYTRKNSNIKDDLKQRKKLRMRKDFQLLWKLIYLFYDRTDLCWKESKN